MRPFDFLELPRSKGAALISALLTVALATLLASQLISTQGAAIENLFGRKELSQARWLARGAADWARAILAEDARTSRIDHLGEPWTIKVPPIPIQSGENQDTKEGELSGEINELDGRFNLNRLTSAGVADPSQIDVFSRLLVQVGVSATDSAHLAKALADWMDNDQITAEGASEVSTYGIPLENLPLLGTGTLARVPGYSFALANKVQPFVCALPRRRPVNLNTAPIEVLMAELPVLSLSEAQRILSERERAPFRDLADFSSRFPGLGPTSNFGVSSSYFMATTRASYGQSVVQLRTLLYRTDGNDWPEILWQQML